MKVSMETIKDPSFWEKAGVRLPRFDIAAMREKTEKEPIWVHFGAGNIFRAYIAAAPAERGAFRPGHRRG